VWTVFVGSGGAGLSSHRIISNALAPAGAAANMFLNQIFAANSEAYFTLTAQPAIGDYIDLAVRLQDTASITNVDGYSVRYTRTGTSTGTIGLYRIDSFSAVGIGTPANVFMNIGDTFGIVSIGNFHDGWYQNGAGDPASVTTATDSNYPAGGYLGMTIFSPTTVVRGNNFGGGEVVPSLNQEGFRFRNDDGSETTATWRQAQDTDDSVEKSTPIRLRLLIDATNDPANQSYQVEFRKAGSLDWRKLQ
jgi:hypothetical protein